MNHREIIKKGSKSFSLASFFFSEKERMGAWKLYSWCRYCDDLIDSPHKDQDILDSLSYLKNETLSLTQQKSSHFYFSGLYEVIHQFHIPMKYPMDLLEGMESDALSKSIQTIKELEEYCYYVAGTVGLMMCHILGVREDRALDHAVSLGKAMQLTNICRDITEDFKNGRIYIPRDWLKNFGIKEDELLHEKNLEKVLIIQGELLKRSDELYEKGLCGLEYLSNRSAFAVLAAAMIYAEIGKIIRLNPKLSLEERVVVSSGRKWVIICKCLFKMLTLILKKPNFIKVRSPQIVWSMNS